MSQCVPVEQQVFKLVEYQFGRAVVVRIDFIQYHIHLFFYLLFGKAGMEHQVRHQFEGTVVVFLHKDGIDEGFFLGRVGVQLPSYIFHTVQDMPRLPFFGSFE